MLLRARGQPDRRHYQERSDHHRHDRARERGNGSAEPVHATQRGLSCFCHAMEGRATGSRAPVDSVKYVSRHCHCRPPCRHCHLLSLRRFRSPWTGCCCSIASICESTGGAGRGDAVRGRVSPCAGSGDGTATTIWSTYSVRSIEPGRSSRKLNVRVGAPYMSRLRDVLSGSGC